ncbi:hypothetical protein H5410_016213 [Solanum commersonii]|uniref:Uncharacterized protein n=1 Tax=Solanum commersonii TaxID=4109 RepID=A0A9J5ZVM0_SOLCO|nr:hypothetical protein H5410_016213 [Solanum commersonii]
MEDAMRTNQTPYRKSKKIALHICIFCVKRNPLYVRIFGGHQHILNAEEYNITNFKKKKLAIRKSQYLSLGGRQTLSNAVLDSLPTYVLEKLDKLRRDFLWFGNKERKGYYLVNLKCSYLSSQWSWS